MVIVILNIVIVDDLGTVVLGLMACARPAQISSQPCHGNDSVDGFLVRFRLPNNESVLRMYALFKGNLLAVCCIVVVEQEIHPYLNILPMAAWRARGVRLCN